MIIFPLSAKHWMNPSKIREYHLPRYRIDVIRMVPNFFDWNCWKKSRKKWTTMRTFRRTPRRFSPFGFRTNYIFHVVPFTVLLFGIYFVLIIPSMPFEYYACASVGEVGSEEGQRHTCIGPMLGNRREVALGGQKAQREEKVQSSKSPDAEDCGLHSLRFTNFAEAEYLALTFVASNGEKSEKKFETVI